MTSDDLERKRDDESLAELAIPDGILTEEEALDPLFCRLGGYTVYLTGDFPVDFRCLKCSSILYFMLQVDCSSQALDRALYVFACNSASCCGDSGAWVSFFQTRTPRPTVNASKRTTNFWESEVGNLCLEDDQQINSPFPHQSYPCQFPSLALKIVTEFWCEPVIPKNTYKLSVDVPDAEFEDKDVYEKILPLGVDKKFEKFQKRIASYPRQCIRFDCKPLAFSDTPLPEHPCCPICVTPSQYTLQLMPAILNYLPVAREPYLAHIAPKDRSKHPLFGDEMNWGSVFVYSCPNDHAHCIVQQETESF
jgi:hypothetical protein